jgi:hypothetical protein
MIDSTLSWKSIILSTRKWRGLYSDNDVDRRPKLVLMEVFSWCRWWGGCPWIVMLVSLLLFHLQSSSWCHVVAFRPPLHPASRRRQFSIQGAAASSRELSPHSKCRPLAGGISNPQSKTTISNDTTPSSPLPESVHRRQLLYSLLAASGTALLPPQNSQAATTMLPMEVPPSVGRTTDSAADIDWSQIDVMKPPPDDRQYKVAILDNGLRVVLCSDPSSNEAGAAMDVHVGACSDPREIPGLAHFNEHMLFLGTKSYPKEDSFEEFLSANGGSSNAYTASENTVYHFTLQAETDGRLQEGLKRFGSFFTSPLFTEGATGRELNAIESEHAKNLQSDNFRIYQINKGRQNPEHPHSKFFTGNKRTLAESTKEKGIDLRQSLIDFYTRYYSADQMTLAVVGPQSLGTLQTMVTDAFSKIPNRNVGPPEDAWKGVISPYLGNHYGTGSSSDSLIPSFGYVVKVVPVQDLRQATITWPVLYKDDSDRNNALLTKQAQYVSHIIGHEGPGSLLSYLKRQGWANSLSAAGESVRPCAKHIVCVGSCVDFVGQE